MRTVTALLFLLLALPAQAAVLYVDASATGAGTGASWADAYVSLQDALAAARAGDEVWVADGVYRPDEGAAQTEGRRASTFSLKNGVAVYGGFAGGEAAREARDPAANVTVLSGDLGALGVTGDNAFHVVTASGVGATAVLDGFIVRDGAATGTAQNALGGGLYVRGTDPAVGPTLRALTVRTNRASSGGGLYASQAAPLVEGVVFEENQAGGSFDGGSGGGAYVEGGAAVFSGVTFRANTGSSGAGLYATGAQTVTVQASRFESNGPADYGGVGGGLYGTAPVVVRDVVFRGNRAYNGAGAYLDAGADLRGATFENNGAEYVGGALFLSGSARVATSTFTGNTAYYGGAVYVGRADATLSRVVLRGNQAFGYGGAVFAEGADLTLVNADVQANTAAYQGGGVVANNGDLSVVNSLVAGNRVDAGDGGGLSLGDVSGTLVNVTVAGNTASGSGGGAFVSGGSVSIRGSVFGSNEATSGVDEIAVASGSSAVFIARTAVEGGVPNVPEVSDGGGNVAVVGFADPLAGDYRLGAGSPALDAGNVTALPPDETDLDDDGDTAERVPVDLAGAARVQGAGLDLGAFEGAQPNTAPTAEADLVETEEETAVTFNVLDNDSDPNGDALTLVAVDAPAGGAVAFEADGTVTYTPSADVSGVDRFSYTVSDGTAGARGRVTVTVNPVNDPPVAADDEATISGDYYTFAYGTSIEVLLNDVDPDGGPLTIESVSPPENGFIDSFYSSPRFGEPSEGYIQYRPNADFFGTDTFTYTVVDQDGATATATVTVRVNGEPQFTSAPQTEAVVGEPYSFTLVAEDPNGDPLTLRAQTYYSDDLPAWLSFTDNGDGTGTFSGTPGEDDLGSIVTLYVVASDGATEVGYYFSIYVRSASEANRPPVAVDDEATVEENGFVAIAVTENDTDPNGDFLYVGGVSSASFGEVDFGYTFVYYRPAPGFSGTDTFEYTVTDFRGGVATATVRVTVTPVNDAPAFVSLPSPQAVVGQRYEATVAAQDPDGDALTLSTGPLPSWLSFRDNGDGTGVLRGTPRPIDEGLFRVVLRASDGAITTTQTVDISVTGSGEPPAGTAPRDTPPTVAPDVATTAEDAAVTVDVLRNDSDPEGGRPALVAVTQPQSGTARANRDGTVTYTPDADFNGSDFFTYAAHAQNGRVASAQVAVQVQAVNDAPVAGDDVFATAGGEPLVVRAPGLLDNDADVDGDRLTAALATAPPASEGVVVVRPDGSFTFTPADGFAGESRFTYVVRDGSGGEATAVATVRVSGAAGAPGAPTAPVRPVAGAVLALGDDAGETFTVEWAPVRDAEGDAVTYRWEVYLGGAARPVFTAASDGPSVTVATSALRRALLNAGASVGEDVAVRHRVVASDGARETPGPFSTATARIGAAGTAGETGPLGFAHLGPRPNPVRDRTAVALDLPWPADVRVEVFDVTGRQVLAAEARMGAGTGQSVALDASALPAGLYVYRLTATTPGAAPAYASGRLTVVR